MFGPPVAAYIQYCILKMCNPLLVFSPSWFLPPLLLNSGDGPENVASGARANKASCAVCACDVRRAVVCRCCYLWRVKLRFDSLNVSSGLNVIRAAQTIDVRSFAAGRLELGVIASQQQLKQFLFEL